MCSPRVCRQCCCSCLRRRHYVPLQKQFDLERFVLYLRKDDPFTKLPGALDAEHWRLREAGYSQDVKHLVRSGAFCSLAAVGVTATGTRLLDDLSHNVVRETDPVALTSLFLEKLNQVRCASSLTCPAARVACEVLCVYRRCSCATRAGPVSESPYPLFSPRWRRAGLCWKATWLSQICASAAFAERS